MEEIIEKYCHRWNISVDGFYKFSGILAITIYGIKVSHPHWKTVSKGLMKLLKGNEKPMEPKSNAKDNNANKPKIDKKLFKDFKRLLKIMIPGLYTIEAGLLGVHTLALVMRTFLSIYVASLEANVVKFIVKKDLMKFSYMLVKWLFLAVPATFINSSIRYLENRLALSFKSRLTQHIYDLYFNQESYYRVSNLDNRLESIDQCMTEDLTCFSSLLTHLYSRLTKPILDICIIFFSMYKLVSSLKGSLVTGPLMSSAIFFTTCFILKAVAPKFGELVAIEAEKKGLLRSTLKRIATNSEEIAFYGGHNIEKKSLLSCYEGLVKHQELIHNKRLWYVMLEQFLMKYMWSAGGLIMIAIPLMTSKKSSADVAVDDEISARTQSFTFARNLMSSAADASERLLSSYKKIIELTGFVSRISTMLKTFQEVSQKKLIRKNLASHSCVKNKFFDSLLPEIKIIDGVLIPGGQVIEADNLITLENIPIITPNYDIISRSLSIKIKKNTHLLITGPNGCGKSSLFRIIGGLWPVYSGTLKTPSRDKLFYIPQRPYMPIGTLRDQVIYPDTQAEMGKKGRCDADLNEILEIVSLLYIVQREGGWDTVNDWTDVLSGGEKQRIGMARLFYHDPQFALLDECTSAVSIDVEHKMYEAVLKKGITLLTITHRPSLWKFHNQILKFDGNGNWTLETLNESFLES